MTSTLPTAGLRVLLLDADGNLFPSEEPAFVASADVTNRFLASLDVPARYTAEELLATTTGKNFRPAAVARARANGGAGGGDGPTPGGDVLNDWVAEEKKVVS